MLLVVVSLGMNYGLMLRKRNNKKKQQKRPPVNYPLSKDSWVVHAPYTPINSFILRTSSSKLFFLSINAISYASIYGTVKGSSGAT